MTGYCASIVKVGVFALAQLPDWQGLTLRGGNLEPHQLEKYQPGQIVTESAFTSTSATAGFKGNTFFVCRSEHGKDVSELSENAAQDGVGILFPPGTHFKVLSREEAGPNTIIVMTEVS